MTAPSADDRREIEECLYRYAWMVDQRKWELMDSVFTADGTIDYTSTGGKRGHIDRPWNGSTAPLQGGRSTCT